MTASTASRAGWTLGGAGAALFMTALDQLVVGVALHSIRIDLGGSIEGLEWTVNAYTLAFAVLLITVAALGDRFGRKYANGSTRPAGPPGTSSGLWPRRPPSAAWPGLSCSTAASKHRTSLGESRDPEPHHQSAISLCRPLGRDPLGAHE
jgi:MFS family permease